MSDPDLTKLIQETLRRYKDRIKELEGQIESLKNENVSGTPFKPLPELPEKLAGIA